MAHKPRKTPDEAGWTPVCPSPSSSLSTLTPSFHKSCAARHIRKGRNRRQLYRFFPYRLCPRLCFLLDTRSCGIFHPSLHCNHWQRHEEIHIKPHTACIFHFTLASSSSAYRLSLKHVAESGALAEEVISSLRTAPAFGAQDVDQSLRCTRPSSAYALAFQFGTALINEGYANAGQVVNVLRPS
ncbi:hypothetical protein HD554DRAFT_1412883 [Boletus coccyginus]|nr:hypothetical protein HD554DRAFT_1412883 [Boletus coccyginus]